MPLTYNSMFKKKELGMDKYIDEEMECPMVEEKAEMRVMSIPENYNQTMVDGRMGTGKKFKPKGRK